MDGKIDPAERPLSFMTVFDRTAKHPSTSSSIYSDSPSRHGHFHPAGYLQGSARSQDTEPWSPTVKVNFLFIQITRTSESCTGSLCL